VVTLFASMDFAPYIPLAVFGACAVVVWLLMEKLAADKPRAEKRLDEFRDPAKRRDRSGGGADSLKKGDAMSRMLEKASPAFAKPLPRPKWR